MGREAFGQYAERRRKALSYSRGHVATRLVIASGGNYFDTTSVRSIEEGRREITPDLYEWLIEILDLDPDEAHAALFGLPEGITVEDIKELRRQSGRMTTRRLAARAGSRRGGQDAATGLPTSLQGEEKRASLQRAGVAA
jgi:transcriptional regulator with XRE-family HTH domain